MTTVLGRPKKAGSTDDSGTAARAPGRSNPLYLLFQMLLNTAAIYVCFGVWSVKQERVMTKPYELSNGEQRMMKSFLMVGVFQAVAGAIIGLVLLLAYDLARLLRVVGGTTDPKAKSTTAKPSTIAHSWVIWQLLTMSFTNAFGSSFGYLSMRYVSYPVVLCTKMSKMVPVMLVGALWHGVRYPMIKYVLCAVLTSGILVFTLAENGDAKEVKRKPRDVKSDELGSSSTYTVATGLVLLAVNLIADGFTNSTQDMLVKVCGWSGNTLMILTNAFTAGWFVAVLAALEVVSPQFITILGSVGVEPLGVPLRDFSQTLELFRAQPQILYDLATMSFLNATGQVFIFRTIQLFGTLTLTAMTLVRKCGSVLLSIVVHGHRLSATQWVALLVVFIGVVGECYVNIRQGGPKAPRHGKKTR